MKICCNFSLTKFIQNCSKPFLCRGKATKSVSDLRHNIPPTAFGWLTSNRTDLEYLKSVNVEHSDTELFVWLLDGFIYGLEKTNIEKKECLCISTICAKVC